MEMYVCEKCKEPIEKVSDLVSCPECGKTYHRRCSLSISNCVCCDCSNVNFESGVNEFVKDNSTRTQIDNNEITVNLDSGMFSDIGGKIKTLATVVTVIGIILGVIVFISMAFVDELFFSGLLTGVAIALFSWIGSFALAGFGTLISSTQNTEKLLRNVLKEMQNKE